MTFTKTTTKTYEIVNIKNQPLFKFNSTYRMIRGEAKYHGFNCFKCGNPFVEDEDIYLWTMKNTKNKVVCEKCNREAFIIFMKDGKK